ncbi:MAG TPA: hypothetical protein VGH63_13425, partial [Polyangia bacterium]
MGRFAIAGLMLASLAGCGGTQATAPNGSTPGGADDPGSTNAANDLSTTPATDDGGVAGGGG